MAAKKSPINNLIGEVNKAFGTDKVVNTVCDFFNMNGVDIAFDDGVVIDTKRVRVKNPRRARRK
jgi:hypothetical protein